MLVSTPPPPSSSSFSLGCSNCLRCHVEPMICSMSYGLSCSSIKTPFELQRVSQYSGLRCSLVTFVQLPPSSSLSHLFTLCAQVCPASVILLLLLPSPFRIKIGLLRE